MSGYGLCVLFFLAIVVFVASRRWALIGMLAAALFLTQGQQWEIFGLNIYAVRIVELVAFSRVVMRQEIRFLPLNAIDKALLILYVYSAVVSTLRAPSGAAFNVGALVDALLCYFTFRALIRNVSDLRWCLHALLILLLPYAALVVFESRTRINFFALMGNFAPEGLVRAGRIRCQGSFRHPILLGTVGASFVPLYVADTFLKGRRIAAILGIASCLVIVWASNSGGPVSCTGFAVVGWLLWRFRQRMRMLRVTIVMGLILLTITMRAPVWYVLSRASALTGGGGWHRSYLIDTAMQHLDQWWLAGMAGKDTMEWFLYHLEATGGADITNGYLVFGIRAGIVAIALLVALLVCGFQRIGSALHQIRVRGGQALSAEFYLWGLGVVMIVHVVNWFGISYFDQIYVFWFMQLAAASSLSDQFLSASASGTLPLKSVEDNGNASNEDGLFAISWRPKTS